MNRVLMGTLLGLMLAVLCAARALGHDFGSMRVDLRPQSGSFIAVDVLADLDHVPTAMRADFAAQLAATSSVLVDGGEFAIGAAVTTEHVLTDGKPTSQIRMHFDVQLARVPKSIGFKTTLALPEYYVVVHTADVHSAGPSGELGQWVSGGEASKLVEVGVAAAPMGRAALLAQYIVLGFEHIVPLGYDHILFVLGLCLLGTKLRPLLMQVTAFTIAHSITLGLSLTGVISLPAQIVEPLIAVSIAYVAIENVLRPRMTWARVAVVFGFGLVHGMGFAGVLREVGIPADRLWTALLGFNVGVELGQLSVIAGAFALVGAWCRGKEWYRGRVVIPVSACIALFALGLTVQRVLVP